jgi:hypothetical protein
MGGGGRDEGKDENIQERMNKSKEQHLADGVVDLSNSSRDSFEDDWVRVEKLVQ